MKCAYLLFENDLFSDKLPREGEQVVDGDQVTRLVGQVDTLVGIAHPLLSQQVCPVSVAWAQFVEHSASHYIIK